MEKLLEVRRLQKQFSGFSAVKNLSFSVNKGDVYGFLGQNGAGKSTTLRMLLKLIRPDAGEILFSGKNVRQDHNAMLRRTGAVIERPDLYKYLSAYDNLSIFARLSGIKASRSLIMDQLEQVGLAERYSSKVKTFSQGMKQRLGIAVALIHSPDLVILDEPLNGLDPQGIADMRQLITELSRDQQKTIIVSSHLLSEIEIVANRMIILHRGEKIIEGEVKELLDPAKTIVEIQTINNAEAIEVLRSSAWSSYIDEQPGKIRFRINREKIPELAASVAQMNIGLLSLQPRHSLEDYFLSLTNENEDVHTASN